MNSSPSRALPACVAAAWLLAAAGVLAGSSQLIRQTPPQPVKWSLALDPASGRVGAGRTLTAVVTVTIDEGWHIYAPDEAKDGPRGVSLTVVKDPVFAAAGKVIAPEPKREMDEAFGQITAFYTEKAAFRLPVRVAAGAAAGPHLLEIDVGFQACDGRICLPARSTRVKATVSVTR